MRSFTGRELAINTAGIARHYPAWLARPRLPRSAMRAYQLARLKALVAHAAANVPLYRETYHAAGISPKDLRSLDDLRHFPTVSKADVLAAYPEAALARGLDPRKLLVSKSSGSTGEVLHVVHQADRLSVQGLAMNRLLRMIAPYRPWHRFMYVYTAPYPARSLLGAWPMIFVPTLAPTSEIAAQLREVRPQLLACYPSHLRAIARELGPDDARGLGLHGISVSSEPSSAEERAELGKLFGCRVHDEYSTEELTRVAAQCRHGTYHLFEDVAYVETLDPETGLPTPDGIRGEITGTYLHNYAMPFIRYRQGDLATIADRSCACGWRFRALTELGGRKLDQFVLPSGRVLTSGWLLDASYSFLFDVGADIAAFTMIQETPSRVRIEIVPGAAYADAMTEAIARRFKGLVDEPLEVEVTLLPELRRSAGGKHHPIVSRISRARGASGS
jgi:phenylacetate-CoA ligase